MTKTVVLGGGAAPFGAKLVRAFIATGARVRGVFRDVSEAKGRGHPRFEPYRGDVLDPPSLAKAMRGADVYVHAAGVSGPTRDPAAAEHVEVEGLRGALHAAREARVRRAIVVNSALIFGPTDGYGFATERTRPLRADYVLSEQFRKYAARDAAREARRESFDVSIVYPAPLRFDGPDAATADGYLPALVAAYGDPKLRKLLPFPRGRWSVASASDAAIEIADLVDAPGEPNAEIVVSGETTSIAETLGLPSTEKPSRLTDRLANVAAFFERVRGVATGETVDPTIAELAAFVSRDWVFASSPASAPAPGGA